MIEKTNFDSIKHNIVNWISMQTKIFGDKIAIRIDGTVNSFVAACMCIEAVGTENVKGLVMLSASNAKDIYEYHSICALLGIRYQRINVEPIMDMEIMQYSMNMDSEEPVEISKENMSRAKDRVVMNMMRLWADTNGYCLCGSNNYSMITTGNFTRGGDNCCDFNPNARITSIEIEELAKKFKQYDEFKNIIKATANTDGALLDGVSDENIHRYIRGIKIGEDGDKIWYQIHDAELASLNYRVSNPTYMPTDEELGKGPANYI